MSADTELNAWRREWQSEKTDLPDLSGKVQRHSRFMRWMVAGEVLVTAVMGGGAILWALRSPDPDVAVLAGAIWLFLATAWIFAWINRRGCWAPAALDASAFLDISIRRCRRGIAETTFWVALYSCEVVFCLAWNYRRVSVPLEAFLISLPVVIVWICTAAFGVFVIWYRRRKQAELAYLLQLQPEPIKTPGPSAARWRFRAKKFVRRISL